ncbi:MAG: hypothetical protein ABIV51_03970 [Saprospiraceae bacterium]
MNKIGLIFLAQNLVEEFKKEKIYLDYSVSSLKEIETYLATTISDSKIKKGSLFRDNTDSMAFALGAYLGEVIRKNCNGVRWNTDDMESAIGILQESPSGAKAFTINRAYKRIFEGESDSVHQFAEVMIRELLKYTGEIPSDFYDAEDLRINKYGDSKVVIYSNSIEENNNVVYHIYHDNGVWYFSGAEDPKMGVGENFTYKFLDEIKEAHGEFAHLLQAKEKLRIIRQDDGSYREHLQHKGPFYDSHTIPSFQGDMKLNIPQWCKYNPKKIFRSTLFLLIGFVLMIEIHWLFVLLVIGALLYNIWYWVAIFNQFKGGDANPGKVISINPTLVAIATNMRKSTGDYPILKIVETRLPKEDNILNKIIPTVALYNDNPHGYPFWAEFHPVPVIQGINDRKRIEYLISCFSQESLDSLEKSLLNVGQKEVGIYKVDENESSWSNYRHVDISKGVSLEKPIEQSINSNA